MKLPNFIIFHQNGCDYRMRKIYKRQSWKFLKFCHHWGLTMIQISETLSFCCCECKLLIYLTSPWDKNNPILFLILWLGNAACVHQDPFIRTLRAISLTIPLGINQTSTVHVKFYMHVLEFSRIWKWMNYSCTQNMNESFLSCCLKEGRHRISRHLLLLCLSIQVFFKLILENSRIFRCWGTVH
jgi:hypothetical protein